MTEEQAFIDRIAAVPNDKHVKLVYADWLAERGQVDREMMIRIQALGWIAPQDLDILYGYEPGTVAAAIGYKERFTCGYADGYLAAECHKGMIAHRVELEKAQAKIRRQNEWLQLAAKGDAQALLSHPQSRLAMEMLARGAPARGKRVSDFTSSRKAVARAKQLMAERIARRADRSVAESARSGRLSTAFERLSTEWRRRAIDAAFDYHMNVKPLFKSERATIKWGRGGQQDSGFPYRGQFKGWRASWKNAGVRLDDDRMPKFVILENYLGKEVARLPMPRS